MNDKNIKFNSVYSLVEWNRHTEAVLPFEHIAQQIETTVFKNIVYREPVVIFYIELKRS